MLFSLWPVSDHTTSGKNAGREYIMLNLAAYGRK